MDDPNTPANISPAEEPIMDVQAPSISPSDPAPSPEPTQIPTPAVAAPVAPTSFETPSASIGSSSHEEESVQPGKPEDAPEQANPSTVQGGAVKNTRKMKRVVLILVIALILAALAVYFYTKKGKTTSAKSTTTTKSASTSSTDINDTIKSVDSTVTTSDSAQDLATSDLSSSALGL